MTLIRYPNFKTRHEPLSGITRCVNFVYIPLKLTDFVFTTNSGSYTMFKSYSSLIPRVFKLNKSVREDFSSATTPGTCRITTFNTYICNPAIFIKDIIDISFTAVLRKISNIDSTIIVVSSVHTVTFSTHRKIWCVSCFEVKEKDAESLPKMHWALALCVHFAVEISYFQVFDSFSPHLEVFSKKNVTRDRANLDRWKKYMVAHVYTRLLWIW